MELTVEIKKILRLVLAFLFLLLGLIGLFLPILPGLLFIIIGLAILGIDIRKLFRKIFKKRNKTNKK